MRTKKREYPQALADLDRSIALDDARIESYRARAEVHEAQGGTKLAIADLQRATELKPKGLFDALAQADAKKRLNRLSKRNSCGDAGRGGDGHLSLRAPPVKSARPSAMD